MSDGPRVLQLGGNCEVQLLEGREGFRGIGHVSVSGVQLRSPRRPMFVEIRSPSGVELSNYRLVDHKLSDSETVLKFDVDRKDGGIMEWMLHTVRNRYNTSDWSLEPQPAKDTALELVLKPVERSFRGDRFEGFSYQYRYQSESIPIYRILDRGTWEIGGGIAGNTFWLRNGTVDSVFKFDGGPDPYSTEWYLPPIQQPNIFQFLPFQTQMQGFTLTEHKDGILLTRPTEVAHIRSLFERDLGGNELAHWHEHCGDLAHEFSTSPVEVLFHHAPMTDKIKVYNVWEAVRDDTWKSLHEQAGLRQERATSYAVLEEWGMPDFDLYLQDALPVIRDAGIKTIMLPSQFTNNMNAWGVSNMCCQVDLNVAESIGPDKFAKFCNTAKDDGITIELWGNTALSSLTYIFNMHDGPHSRINFLPQEGSAMEALKHARSPWVRNASGAIEADHYTPVFCALNLRDPVVRSYWNRSWKKVHDECGVQGIFVDSSFNMSSDKFHWMQNEEFDRDGGATIDQTSSLGHTRPTIAPKQAIQTQYPAYLEMLAEMQKMGYAICGEDVGVFGTSRSGPDVTVRMRCLPLWLDSYCPFDPDAIRMAGKDPDEIYFKGLAYRLVWYIYWDIQRKVLSFQQSGGHPSKDPSPWHLSLIKALNEAHPYWQNRTILPDEKGVVYEGPDGTALWAFQDLDHPVKAGESAKDVLTGEITRSSSLPAQKHHIYLITSEKGA